MNFLKKLTIVFVVITSLLFLASPLYANDICPEGMDLDQCRKDLEKKMADLERQGKVVTQNLSAERYNQLSLSQQIDYTKRKISESEFEIKKTEIELETKNVEIRMMERDIEETQNNIATVQQESQKLESSISKRLSMSYKYSFMNPVELLVNSQDLNMLLRKMKYLVDTRNNDKVLLGEMRDKNVVLDAQEKVLGTRKLDLEKTRIEVENKKTDLFKQKENLASQQKEHTRLLALSKQREASYEATLTEIQKMQNQVTNQIQEIIRLMYERGQIAVNRPVKKGEIIGFQGYTGYTYGAHLHLVVYNSSGQSVNPFSAGYFSGGSLGAPVGSSTYHLPVAGGVLTQSFWASHRAIDIQSHSSGDQSGGTYNGAELSCYGLSPRRAGNYNTRGTGAPIYAITSGYVSDVQVDACGGKYVVLKHDDGGSSLYLHLK